MHRLFTRFLIYGLHKYNLNISITKWLEYLFDKNVVNIRRCFKSIHDRSIEEIVVYPLRPFFECETIHRFFYSLLRTIATRLPWHYVFSSARLYSTHSVRGAIAKLTFHGSKPIVSHRWAFHTESGVSLFIAFYYLGDAPIAIGIFIISRNRL